MSSFKRKTPLKDSSIPVGTRALSGPAATLVTSTGVPSLDDILGGGLPMSCSLLIRAQDAHSAYGELLQKYFISQGLLSGHNVCIIDNDPAGFASGCMWRAEGASNEMDTRSSNNEEGEGEGKVDPSTKIQIAWRYEQLRQFQTTVSSPATAPNFCQAFDLTTRIPASVLEDAASSSQLVHIKVDSTRSDLPYTRRVLHELQDLVAGNRAGFSPLKPLRISIPTLGSPQWGDLEPGEVCFFLHALRGILRRHTYMVAMISLSPHTCTDMWGGSGWVQKLSWLCDGSISLSAFSANPSLLSLFPAHHGFVHMHSLPAPHSLQSPSDRFSTLRGLTSSGENNLAFKCMRKRLVIETLHLDLEGGVGERRTTPSGNTNTSTPSSHHDGHSQLSLPAKGEAALRVAVENAEIRESTMKRAVEPPDAFMKKTTKPKKKVLFHSDRPDLYDF